MEAVKLGISGTIGKNGNPGPRWGAAIGAARRLCRSLRDHYGRVILVSGASPWGDSIAPRLFLDGEVDGLQLHLPAGFSVGQGCFIEDGYESAGAITNRYHEMAVRRGCGYDGLHDLTVALTDPNVTRSTPVKPSYSYKDFWNRNWRIADGSDLLLVVDFGMGRGVPEGHSSHIVRHFLQMNKRPHVTMFDLTTGECYLADPRRMSETQQPLPFKPLMRELKGRGNGVRPSDGERPTEGVTRGATPQELKDSASEWELVSADEPEDPDYEYEAVDG